VVLWKVWGAVEAERTKVLLTYSARVFLRRAAMCSCCFLPGRHEGATAVIAAAPLSAFFWENFCSHRNRHDAADGRKENVSLPALPDSALSVPPVTALPERALGEPPALRIARGDSVCRASGGDAEDFDREVGRVPGRALRSA